MSSADAQTLGRWLSIGDEYWVFTCNCQIDKENRRINKRDTAEVNGGFAFITIPTLRGGSYTIILHIPRVSPRREILSSISAVE